MNEKLSRPWIVWAALGLISFGSVTLLVRPGALADDRVVRVVPGGLSPSAGHAAVELRINLEEPRVIRIVEGFPTASIAANMSSGGVLTGSNIEWVLAGVTEAAVSYVLVFEPCAEDIPLGPGTFEIAGVERPITGEDRLVCEEVGGGEQETFRRGDFDSSARVDLTDAISLLGHLFLGWNERACLDAGDTDDNGSNDVTDAIAILLFLFLGAPAPPAPGPHDCGADAILERPNLGCDLTCQ